MASDQRQIAASPSGSPVRKKPCVGGPPEEDADAMLESLIQSSKAEVASSGEAPAWALAMQSTLQVQIQRSHNLMLSFHDRLQKLESSDKHLQLSDRVDKLEQLMQSIVDGDGKKSEGQPSSIPSYTRVPPPSAHPISTNRLNFLLGLLKIQRMVSKVILIRIIVT